MLRNAPLRSKLIVTLVGPLLALMVLAAVVIRSSLVESDKAARVNERARFAGKLAPLIHELQAERSLSSSYVAGGRSASPAQLDRERRAVDQVASTYRAAAARLDLGGDPALRERVGYGLRELNKLQTQRAAIDAGPIHRNEAVEPEIEEGESAATPQQLEIYRRAVQGPEIERVEHMRHGAVETGGQGPVPGDATTWFQASSVELDRLRGVEQRLSTDVVATSASMKSAADHRALLYTLLLLAALVLAVSVSLATAGSLIRRLGRLKDVAHDVAERKLPGVVSRLREGDSVDLNAESATPIEAHARDEIGQLGEAFSFVHQVAVQVAGREAALRRSVGDMFLNLARRSQSLVERQLELIGDLGARNIREAMVELSELDHLAGRMRRNAENLIVLSGAEPARRWRGPVGVGDVVMAAVDEVREHGRVATMPIQTTLVAGHAASDVVRLLAELLENALSFSAPDTKALVAGQALPTTYLLEIEDQGIGMSDEQFADVNSRLSGPPEDVDLAHAKMLGFFVVGQLAARHGIKVQLRRSRHGGVAALVLLPASLIVQSEALPQTGSPVVAPDGGRMAQRSWGGYR